MALTAGMKNILKAVSDLGPIKFADLENEMRPMCERILSSHLKRLQKRGLVEYDKGYYLITEEGKVELGD